MSKSDRRHLTVRAAMTVAAMTVAGLVTAAPFAANAVAVPTPAAVPTSAEVSASAQAQSVGSPVAVDSETTETSQVLAQPDGTFTLTASAVPVRVPNPDGSWSAIDTSLRTNADGTLSPVATTQPVSFSSGGSGPVITIAGDGADAGKAVSFTWPTPLPAPTVSGDTATYTAVLPGVDLRVSAHVESFSEVLVIHDAAAAANPALKSLKLSASGTGVTVATGPTGGLIATDPTTGAVVFQGSPPIAWDSTLNPQLGSAPTSTDTGSGAITRLSVTAGGATPNVGTPGSSTTDLTLGVPAGALSGANITYPVYVDPSMSGTGHYAVVLSNGAPYYDDSAQHPKVGYCGYSGCNGIGTARAYFQIGTATLANRATTAHINTADFTITQIHNGAGACAATPVDLRQSGPWSPSITWGGPAGAVLWTVAAPYSDMCTASPPNRIHFASSSVINYVQAAANNDSSTMYFALLAPHELDLTEWKQFNNDAQLVVGYDFPPSVPTALNVSDKVACPGKPIYTRSTTPTVYAHATDNNPSPSNVGLYFQVWNNPATVDVRYNSLRVLDPSNTTVPWATNTAGYTNSTAALADGNYQYRVYAYTGAPPQQVGPTAFYPFTIDHTAPATTTISSFDYRSNGWGATAGAPGTFTVTSAGSTGFAYSFDSGSVVIPTDTDCNYNQPAKRWISASAATATITPTGLAAGYHTLNVKSFDDAHNFNTLTSATFYVSPTVANEGPTKLEAETLAANGQLTISHTTNGNDLVYIEGTSGLWSGGQQEHLLATAATDSISITVNVPLEADYALGMELTKASHYGQLNFSVDGHTIQCAALTVCAPGAASTGGPLFFDGYSAAATVTYVPLGGAHLSAGQHTIGVTVIGKNAASTDYQDTHGPTNDHGYSAGIDFLNLIPINNITAASFTAAMNNHGTASDAAGPSGAANIGPSITANGLSQQALAAAGFGAGQTVTVDAGTPNSATFTMPTYPAGAADNVMADGQTIPLSAPVQANSLDLLAMTTCGVIPDNGTVQVSVNFGSGPADDKTSTDLQIPAMPNWTTAALPPIASRTVATTMTKIDLNGAADATHQATLYHLRLTVPRHDGTTATNVTGIVLPNIGSTFLPNCATPTLHVFAMTTT